MYLRVVRGRGDKILVTGGDIDVISSDDGFNAAGGSSGSGDNHDGLEAAQVWAEWTWMPTMMHIFL